MHRILKSLGVLALALAAFTGTALAGNGNGGTAPGNSANAPGQVKQQQPATVSAPAPAKASAPGQVKKSASTATPSAPTHATSHGSGSQNSSSVAGVKPTNVTAKSPNHWTTAGANPDVSKRYGNGQTAAQIATSRGASSDTKLYGPGNSQPHKVSVCGKANGHYVDVHAVKSYDTSACTTSSAAPTKQTEQTSACGSITTTTTSTRVQHGHAYGRLKHGLPLHTSVKTVSVTQPTGETCTAAQLQAALESALLRSQQSSQTSQSSQASQQSAAANAVSGTAARSGSGPAAGGVLGATKTLKSASAAKPATGSRGGVLGAVASAGRSVAHGTLPFTGLPLWIALVAAAALVAAGFALRRRGGATL